jgi:vanillate O-demethylase monooxygenase subunit
MDSGSAPTGARAPQGTRRGAYEFRGCQAITPETSHSTHYLLAQPHSCGCELPGLTAAIHANVVAAFDDYQAMIGAQAATLALDPGFRPRPLAMNTALIQFRSLIARPLAEAAGSH